MLAGVHKPDLWPRVPKSQASDGYSKKHCYMVLLLVILAQLAVDAYVAAAAQELLLLSVAIFKL